MDRRSMAVLYQLVQNDSYITVQEIATLLNVSRRTIYNDLSKINDWLNENNLPEIIYVHRKGICLDDSIKEELITKFSILNQPYYEYSPDERRAWIYIYITVHEPPSYLEDFMNLFQVSRNTVLEDIRKLKSDVKKFQLKLYAEHQHGYQISGDENDVRRGVIHFLHFVVPENGWYMFVAGDDKASSEQLLEPYKIFQRQELLLLVELLNEYEKRYLIEFTDDILNHLVVWFYLFFKRVKQGKIVHIDEIEKEVIHSTDEYDGARKIYQEYNKKTNFAIAICEDEVHYLTKYLLSSKVNYSLNLQPENEEMKKLNEVVEKMISDFQLLAVVNLPNKDRMIQNLLIHMKPAYYRIKYGIKIENMLTESVRKNYPEVFYLTKKVIHHFEDLVNQPVHDNEIAYITMHFGGWLRKEGITLKATRKKLLIVCTTGLGTSRLLESQLEGLFSDTDIVGVTSQREYEKMDLSVDFIISTVPLLNRGIPVFVTKPILDNQDKERLLKYVNCLNKQPAQEKGYSVETVMDIIKRYAIIEKDEELRQELRRYLQAPLTVNTENSKNNLIDLLPKKRIIQKNSVNNWQEAIRETAFPLLEQGFITRNYIQKMIEYVIEKGPYIVISNGLAVPHAMPIDGVKKTGMSMLQLKEPVDFIGKTVRVLIVLASWDNEQHLKALRQLTKLLSHKKSKEKILHTADKNEIVEIIQGYSTD